MEKLSDSAYQWMYYRADGPLLSIETYKDENSKTLNGYIAFFDTEGRIDSGGFTNEGKKDKHWYYFDDNLKVSQSEEYSSGKLIKRKDQAMLKAESDSLKALKGGPLDREAEFTGGTKKWINYLQKNLSFPKRAMQLRKTGNVVVSFVVNTDGKLSEISLRKSVELTLDLEAMRLIKNSPDWEPAMQTGKPVKAYRLQPITFAM
ncbi:MAG TPA: energy transducer TonB [Chitinophagaceae bacterium]|nr:energy transducer TonB [Chitinophagaceae bacterium]